MAYYTKITKNNLQKHIAKYNIGKLYKYVGITDGIENTNYFLKTQKGKFVLTIYENKITERIKNKHLPFFINLINFYKLNKIPCPSILSSRNNKKIIHKEEKQIINWARESVVSIKKIKKNDILNKENLSVKRPAPNTNEIPAKLYFQILGKKAKKNIAVNSKIKWTEVK